MNDDSRPHKFPMPPPEGEYIAWKCRACGKWINAYDERGECPIDWRNQ